VQDDTINVKTFSATDRIFQTCFANRVRGRENITLAIIYSDLFRSRFNGMRSRRIEIYVRRFLEINVARMRFLITNE